MLLRTKLIFGSLTAIVTTGLVAAFIGAWMIGHMLAEQAQDKARLDLNSARLIYFNSLKGIGQQLRLMALGELIPELLSLHQSNSQSTAQTNSQPTAALIKRLDRIRRRENLDLLNLTDAHGSVILRGRLDAAESQNKNSKSYEALIHTALSAKDVVTTTLVLAPVALNLEGRNLADQAQISLIPTAESQPNNRKVEKVGMMLMGAVKLTSAKGNPLGVLVGGKLLNKDNRMVDEIRETIYQGEQYRGQNIGESTICLGDIRIATNVKLPGGIRAVGTRVAPAVRQQVLVHGRPYVAPAMVLNERYITAYEPIRDFSGRVVGILSLGIPDQKFVEMQHRAMLVFISILLGGVMLSIFISVWLARRFSRPIYNLVDAVHDLANGQLDRRVKPNHEVKEFVLLSEGFNQMATSLQERDLQLKHRTQETIGKSERLAMIGRLAAGVAHEINNPLGGIMLFSNLLLRKAAPQSQEYENLERICHETNRCQKIVQGLLDFARHREPKTELTDIHEVLDKTLALIENQAMFLNIECQKNYTAVGKMVRVDPLQLQQVFINLIVNAVEAMSGQGKLTLATRITGMGLEISVSDTGTGISEEHLERLFEPFFTTKEVGHGTGLGLSISRNIVENHGGNMWVNSKTGEGATFYVCLPMVEESEG